MLKDKLQSSFYQTIFLPTVCDSSNVLPLPLRKFEDNFEMDHQDGYLKYILHQFQWFVNYWNANTVKMILGF